MMVVLFLKGGRCCTEWYDGYGDGPAGQTIRNERTTVRAQSSGWAAGTGLGN